MRKPLCVYDNDFKTRLWYYGKNKGKAVVKIITQDIVTDKQVEALPFKEYKLYKDKNGEFFKITLGAAGLIKLYFAKGLAGGTSLYRREGFIKERMMF